MTRDPRAGSSEAGSPAPPRPVSPEAAPPTRSCCDESFEVQTGIGKVGCPTHFAEYLRIRAGYAEAAPPRATTPLDDLRACAIGEAPMHGHLTATDAAKAYITILENEIARLRSPLAGSPPTTPETAEERGMAAERDFRRFVVACYGCAENFESEPSSVIGNTRAAFFAGRASMLDRPTPEPSPESGALPTEPSWMPEVLDMIRERLATYLGEESMKGCPPMFYDDAIRSIAHRAAFGKLPEEMYPEGSLLHRLRESESRLSTLERDAARMRERYDMLVALLDSYFSVLDQPEKQSGRATALELGEAALRATAALSPSGEPTTEPT